MAEPQWDAAVTAFREKLYQVRTSLEPRPYAWYPYDSLTNIYTLEALLRNSEYDLDELMGRGTVLDIGCADGELAFFLESQGASVVAVDNRDTNANSMRAAYDLRTALESTVDFRDMDLDSRVPCT